MNAKTDDIRARLELAVDAAREAGWITLEYFGSDDLRVELKSDNSPVTMADRRAEEHLRHRIAESFPDDAITGEELPDRSGNTSYRWIVDPIDGTKSFVHGVPLYGTLVGVVCENEPTIGVIYVPGTQECVYAALGQGAWYSRGKTKAEPSRVSDCRRLEDALFLTSEVKTWVEEDRQDAYHRLQATARLSRTWGDCYGYLMVATGRAEVMVDPAVALWDVAALPPIITEAGGRFTDWRDRPTIHSSEGVATNGHIHQQVMDVLRGG